MTTFDPSGTGSSEEGLFGVPTKLETSKVVVIPVPWEVTTSYGAGTSNGPASVLKASPQIDLFDLELKTAYEQGYHMLDIPQDLRSKNDALKEMALKIRDGLKDDKLLAEVNRGCKEMSDWVYAQSMAALKRGQIPAVLGGDHSSPKAISVRYAKPIRAKSACCMWMPMRICA